MNIQHMLRLVIILASTVIGAPSSPCDPDPCQNGGTCMYESYWPPPHYQCECVGSWSGTDCSQGEIPRIGEVRAPSSPCDQNPCQNGGTCLYETYWPPQHFECECVGSWSGSDCSQGDIQGTEETTKNQSKTQMEIAKGDTAEQTKLNNNSSNYIYNDNGKENAKISKQMLENSGSNSIDNNDINYEKGIDNEEITEYAEDMIDELKTLEVSKIIKAQKKQTDTSTIESSTDEETDPTEGSGSAHEDPCNKKHCHSSGTCSAVTNSHGEQECTCRQGWLGKQCEIQDLCPQSCLTMDRCERNNPEDPKCVCKSGWLGKNCDIEDPCPAKCIREDKCSAVTNAHGQPECTCNQGWLGSQCDIVDLCPQTCLTLNRCERIKPDDQKCVCNAGWLGENCDVEDPCGKCKRQGKCRVVKNAHNTLSCSCKPGWVGTQCDVRNPCSISPCKNGGGCTPILQNNWRYRKTWAYECRCAKGWRGRSCNQDKNECRYYGLNKCVNGDCQNVPGSYNCKCHPGWSGKFCNIIDCSSLNCNNGTCIVDTIGNVRNPICDCHHGFDGSNCEVDEVKQLKEKNKNLERQLQTCKEEKDKENKKMDEERKTLQNFVTYISEEIDNLPEYYKTTSGRRDTGHTGYQPPYYWPESEGSGFYG